MIGGSKPHRRPRVSTPLHNPAPLEAYDDALEDSYEDPMNVFSNASSLQPDVVIDEAGPSGFNLEGTAPEPHPNTTNCNEYGLSRLQRSGRITELIERVGQRRWGTNHVLHVIDDDDLDSSDEEDEMEGEGWISDEDDFQEADKEFAVPSAEPGQEGISLWDLLGEGFLKEASELGISAFCLALMVS
jgi:hypothetical protein